MGGREGVCTAGEWVCSGQGGGLKVRGGSLQGVCREFLLNKVARIRKYINILGENCFNVNSEQTNVPKVGVSTKTT